MSRIGTARFFLTVMFFVMCFAAVASKVWAAEQRQETRFISPEGILFISYSKTWDEPQLERLYRTLLDCVHGEELGRLNKVILDPDKSIGVSGYRLGNYDYKETDDPFV